MFFSTWILHISMTFIENVNVVCETDNPCEEGFRIRNEFVTLMNSFDVQCTCIH